MSDSQTDKPDPPACPACDPRHPAPRSMFNCCCGATPTAEDEQDDAIMRSKRSSRYVTWIASLLFYLLIFLVIGQDFTQHVRLNHRIQTLGQRGQGKVLANEPHLVARGSVRSQKGYRLTIQGDHGLLDFVSPMNPLVGSQVAYLHLEPGMYTRLIDPASPTPNLVGRYLLSWTGLLQLGGMALLGFLMLITVRRIILAWTGKLPA